MANHFHKSSRTDEILTSRFFLQTDETTQRFVFDLPKSWWSRPFEYAWAGKLAEPDQVVLDAASGICHPLKFYLADVCSEVHACDYDKRILSPEKILDEISSVYGRVSSVRFPQKYLTNIHYALSDITDLPYQNGKFNRIFCISVLEHLKDVFNTNPRMWPLWRFRGFCDHSIYLSLKEFKRVLAQDGLIILTFDFPRINLRYLEKIIGEIGLAFAGTVDFDLPEDALYSNNYALYCFRAVLKHA